MLSREAALFRFCSRSLSMNSVNASLFLPDGPGMIPIAYTDSASSVNPHPTSGALPKRR